MALLNMDGKSVRGFMKSRKEMAAGSMADFFVLSPSCMELIADDTSHGKEPLSKLAAQGELMAYEHRGFWQPMDTLRDKNHLKRRA